MCSLLLAATKGLVSHFGYRKLKEIWCCHWGRGRPKLVNGGREVWSNKCATVEDSTSWLPRSPVPLAISKHCVTQLSWQSLKFPGFFTHKLLFCQFSSCVVDCAALTQIKKYLLNGLPSARILKQSLTSESTPFSWGDRYGNWQL